MPTYEYACRGCGEHLEVVQSFRDEPLTTCGACGGVLRKVFSAAGIIFKGSGYYVTDSRKASGSDSEGTSGESGDGDAKKPSKSDSKKPEASETSKSPKTKKEQGASPAPAAESA